MFTFWLQNVFDSSTDSMALFLHDYMMDLSAFQVTTLINGINQFHQLDSTGQDYEDQITAIILVLNRIVNPKGFEMTVTNLHTLIMVLKE